MTLSNDAYLRYQSFNNADELKAEMLRLGPSRFEIGPMYSGRVSWKSWILSLRPLFLSDSKRLNLPRPTRNRQPKDRKALMKSAFRPMTRELVFDIDMTDCEISRRISFALERLTDVLEPLTDDSVRTCCKDKAMCKRCWRFITVAVKVLDEILRGTLQSFCFSYTATAR